MNLDGKRPMEIVARGGCATTGGLRLPPPRPASCTFTDNQRELALGGHAERRAETGVTKPGQHFGYPYCHQGELRRTPQFGWGKACRGLSVKPVLLLGPATRPRSGNALSTPARCSRRKYQNANLHPPATGRGTAPRRLRPARRGWRCSCTPTGSVKSDGAPSSPGWSRTTALSRAAGRRARHVKDGLAARLPTTTRGAGSTGSAYKK